jgi:hypothetical protein
MGSNMLVLNRSAGKDPSDNAWCEWRYETVTAPNYTFDFVGARLGRWRVTSKALNDELGLTSNWRTFTYTK